MGNEIYVVLRGHYEDWKLMCYTTSEEDAIQMCIHGQEKEKEDFKDEYERYENGLDYDMEKIGCWEYERVELAEPVKEKVGIIYEYIVRFRKYDSLDFLLESAVLECFYKDDAGKEIFGQRVKLIFEDFICVNVQLREINIEQAKKIAKDELSRYLDECQESDFEP